MEILFITLHLFIWIPVFVESGECLACRHSQHDGMLPKIHHIVVLCCQVKVFSSFLNSSYAAYTIFSDFTLIFNFIHPDVILMQPKQLASVKVLLIYSAVRESRLLSSCYHPFVSGSSAIHSAASFKKSSF